MIKKMLIMECSGLGIVVGDAYNIKNTFLKY